MRSYETIDTVIIMENTQATPQATQPFEDPRKLAETLSNISAHDATDVICILHTNSVAASEAVKANLLKSPEHILQNGDLHGITEDDVMFDPEVNKKHREFALRISSEVRVPTDGFRFGRSKQYCDIVLTPNENDALISKVHFKIYVNSQGSLMLEDLSTNGTVVDDAHLKCRRHVKTILQKRPATIALKNGSIICVVGEPSRTEIKFMVRIPNRGDHEDVYEDNLRKYLAARGNVATFASMRESSYGNFWNGGSIYNFTGLLGKGAFATVYKVQTKKEGQVYAAKELDKRRFIKNGVLDLKFDSELNIMSYTHLRLNPQTQWHWPPNYGCRFSVTFGFNTAGAFVSEQHTSDHESLLQQKASTAAKICWLYTLLGI